MDNTYGYLDNDHTFITRTIEIARFFGVRHDHVVRDVERLIEGMQELSYPDGLSWFMESNYTNPRNRKYRCFHVTEKGLELLIMSMNGKKALFCKTKLIEGHSVLDLFEGKLGELPSDDLDVRTYIIEKAGSDMIKIGRSIMPYARLKSLQNSSGDDLKILSLIKGDFENLLHRAFGEYQKQGEWFCDTDGIIKWFANELISVAGGIDADIGNLIECAEKLIFKQLDSPKAQSV